VEARTLILICLCLGYRRRRPEPVLRQRRTAQRRRRRDRGRRRHRDARTGGRRAEWPSFLPSALVNLGLDLRGGAHLLAEVRVEDVYKTRIDALWPEVRDALRDLRDQVGNVRRAPSPDGVLRVTIEPRGHGRRSRGVAPLAAASSLTGVGQSTLDVTAEGSEIVVQLSEAEKQATDDRTMQQSLEIIRRRVDEVGTREPTIQRQGEDRILIQVPGIGSAAELKALIGTTAKLTFNPSLAAPPTPAPTPARATRCCPRWTRGVYYIVETPVVTARNWSMPSPPSTRTTARRSISASTPPARASSATTRPPTSAPFAIVLDNEVISAPVIQSHIPGGSGIITGSLHGRGIDRACRPAARRRPAGRDDLP
jgi:preprotein translocase subunit SecD